MTMLVPHDAKCYSHPWASYDVSTIAGIVYLHRISDKRSVGSPQKNMTLFETLCADVKKNVVFATTMWKLVQHSDVGIYREDCWRGLLQSGSRIMRFHDTFSSAWDIINNVVESRYFPTISQTTSLDSRLQAGRVVAVSRPRISYVPPFARLDVAFLTHKEGVDVALSSISRGFFR